MTNFIIQNPWLAVTTALVTGLALGMLQMVVAGASRCEDCIPAKRAREISGREQARVEALEK